MSGDPMIPFHRVQFIDSGQQEILECLLMRECVFCLERKSEITPPQRDSDLNP
ncbi:hypothetical protein ACF0H5_024069 [Mactra antiquata]